MPMSEIAWVQISQGSHSRQNPCGVKPEGSKSQLEDANIIGGSEDVARRSYAEIS